MTETVEIEPPRPADAAVVLLHGLGADGHDFESLVPELRLPSSPAIRWVFPHAPVQAVTLNGGMRMRAWYDILGLDRRAAQDERGIRASAETAAALLRRESERGIRSERLVLAGFSQGGAIALFAGLRYPQRLAGILALSTYLPLDASLAAEAHPANAAVPVFQAHGRFDAVVPPALGEGTRDLLAGRGYDLDWRTYPMPHSLCAEEVADVRAWLLRVLPAL
ncbi:MAG TPA: alpha/beta fold hydrolase [Vicinamibacteria bacterium]|jgi:phospholipase/carboxylesterase